MKKNGEGIEGLSSLFFSRTRKACMKSSGRSSSCWLKRTRGVASSASPALSRVSAEGRPALRLSRRALTGWNMP